MENFKRRAPGCSLAELSGRVTRILQTGSSGCDVEKNLMPTSRYVKARATQFARAPEEKYAIYECRPCKKTFAAATEYDSHQQEDSHRKKIAAFHHGMLKEADLMRNPSEIWCDVCNVKFDYKGEYLHHSKGLKHKNKALYKELDKDVEHTRTRREQIISCELCGITVVGQRTLETHLAGNRHKKNVLKKYGNLDNTTPVKYLEQVSLDDSVQGPGSPVSPEPSHEDDRSFIDASSHIDILNKETGT